MLNKFYETIIFSITFISSRFILFFFPLFFAIFLSKKDFIYFEQALAISNILVPIFTFGFFSLLPKILKENSINYKIEFIKIHNLLIVILLTIIAFLFHKDLLIFCTSIFTIFFVISRFILTVQKIRSKRNIALIIETSFFIILGIAIIYFNYDNILFVSYFLIPFIILYFFSTFNLLEKNKIKSYFSKSNWTRYLNSSIPNLFSGFVIVFIFQYLKIIVPVFFDENESYNFLYIFRFSFIVMISYQFLSAFFFVKLISNNNEIRNKKIFILAKLNFFSLCVFLLIIYSLNKNYFFLNDIFFINNYLNLSILFDNFKIFLICSLFLHIFSFISLNNY